MKIRLFLVRAHILPVCMFWLYVPVQQYYSTIFRLFACGLLAETLEQVPGGLGVFRVCSRTLAMANRIPRGHRGRLRYGLGSGEVRVGSGASSAE